jgi:Na+-driven multidrug efflux pump
LEHAVFQFGKILVQGLIATMGTYAIAANAVGNTVSSITVLPGSALGLAMITIVGRCVGAKEYDQAKMYTRKLMLFTFVTTGLISIIQLLGCRTIVGLFNLSEQSSQIAYQLLMVYNLCCILIWPMAFTLPNALRAAGDAKFTMICSAVSMWLFRVIASYIFAGTLHMGVMGIWIAMYIDWVARAIVFYIRFKGGKWMEKRII